MTDLGGFDAGAARRPRNKLRPEVVSGMAAPPKGEVFEDEGKLVGTFYLPQHRPADVKYHVGRRTITLWSRKEGSEFQTILVLPRWVNPATFVLSHHNGIYEFVLEGSDDERAAT